MFRYRLETLLRYRESREQTGRRSVAEADRRVMSTIRTLKDIEEKQHGAMNWLEQVSQAPTGSSLLSLYDRYIAGLRLDSALGAVRMRNARAKADEGRAKLLELVKKRKIIELHKEKLKERYNAEQARRERLVNDEIAVTHHAARKEMIL